jgi:5-(carboxyamino)imidazole ribonucleotide synthase
MIAMEARRMGYRTLVLDPGADGPAAQVCDAHLRAPLDDPAALRRLVDGSAVVTFEWENADGQALAAAAEAGVPLRPSPDVLLATQHRVREKEAIRRLGIPTAEFRPVGSGAELRAALAELGTPAVLKSARGGYDGRGQARIRGAAEADAAFASVAASGTEWVLEAWVPFDREISVVCARSARGEVAAFPVAENIHHEGVLDVTLAPARVSPGVAGEARRIAETLIAGLDVVGLLGVEMFVEASGRVLVNELAPRPHNSAHFTWEACGVSQFGLPGAPLPRGDGEPARPPSRRRLDGEGSRGDLRARGFPSLVRQGGTAPRA